MKSIYAAIKNSKLMLSLLVVASLLWLPAKAFSQSAAEFGVVINLSGKQRMLTQKMSKEIMLIALDVNTAENTSALAKTAALFDKTLTGLRQGDSDLKLPATESQRILRQLIKVESLWGDFFPIVKNIVDTGTVTSEQISLIAGQNLPLLKEMNKAVGAFEKEAAKSGLKTSPGLAATLNLSGKQRMLTQKMSKEFLLIAAEYDAVNNRLSLLETFTLFERTLNGLKKGDDTLGLSATTDASILSQLDEVAALWQKAKPVFEASSASDSKIDKAQIELVSSINLPLLKEMNKAVGMYEKLAK